MNELNDILVDRIRRDGPITFAEYMSSALYDPEHGYYSAGGERTGWRGHFLTSPELDPAFGMLWTRGIEQVWRAAGRPASFDVVEVGPGEGGFAAALLDSAEGDFADALTLTLVELAPERRARQAARLGESTASWVDDVSDVGRVESGLVFLNEVLDNQPVHALRRVGDALQEMYVTEREGVLVELWQPCTSEGLVERASGVPAPGGSIEISVAAESLAATCAALVDRGAIVFVDYGREKEGRPGDSLVTFSASGVDALRLDGPGGRDITAHVDWGPIRAVLKGAGFTAFGPHRQRRILQTLGAGELDARLRDRHRDELDSGRGAAAVRMLSRRQALRALLDPGGLGHLQVLAGIKGIETPEFLDKEEDRS